jgi:hypothetical protein
MVTAEAALVLPLIAAFAIAMVFLVVLGLAKLATVDAARDAARAVARGDDPALAVTQAERTAPRGADVSIARDGDQVSVTVRAVVQSPDWLFLPLPETTVSSRAVVEAESDVGLP